MPRHARVKSESNIYHVMLRSINKQQIFEDDEDFEKYLQVLKDCKNISEFKLFAYCLMGNHVHLLIQEAKEPLELIFKRIGSRYVYWYNIKYHRTGHLFQDRFKSEPVNTDEYLLTVLRYIHQNPINAKLCQNLEEYRYSSYAGYANNTLLDPDFIFEKVSPAEFARYHTETSSINCLDLPEKTADRVTDEQAKQIIQELSGCRSISDFQALTINDRDRCLKIFRDKGLSIRQISRLTGTSFSVVRKK